MKKKIFSRQEQIAYLTEDISDKLEIMKTEGRMFDDEIEALDAIINYAQSVILYFKTTSEEVIPNIFNLLISASNYLKVEDKAERVVLLNILKDKYQVLSNIHSEGIEPHNITM